MSEHAPRHVLEDLLRPHLQVVFCGTQAGRVSAAKRAYYAGPGNRFWPVLKLAGLIPENFLPGDFRRLPEHGIGLTDVAKETFGPDASLRRHHFDIDGFIQRIEQYAPKMVAFNGKRAASEALGIDSRRLQYGLHPCAIGALRSSSSPRRQRRRRTWNERYLRLARAHASRAPHEAPRADIQHRPGRSSASRSSCCSSPAWAFATLGGYVSKTFLADPLTMLDDGWLLLTKHGFATDIARHHLARDRRLRARRARRRADRHPDGRLQADRGVLRAVRIVRALSAGLRLHSAADPVGRHRRGAEAAGDLHRLGVPDRADGGAHGRQRAARPRRGRADARRARPTASSRAC